MLGNICHFAMLGNVCHNGTLGNVCHFAMLGNVCAPHCNVKIYLSRCDDIPMFVTLRCPFMFVKLL
jgi:hypothetical protein